MLSTPALWVAFAAMVPLMLLAAWSDLKYLQIPNTLVLIVFAVFLVTGFWGLPTETFLWRLLYGVCALAIGFGLFSLGVMGGGDAKMIAAVVPFIVPEEVGAVLLIYAVCALAFWALLKSVMMIPREHETGWYFVDQQLDKSRKRTDFPLGLIIGSTVMIYLGIHAWYSLPTGAA
ncbi:MAG: prepilin peptidase [Pseudomonadota bacterium]